MEINSSLIFTAGVGIVVILLFKLVSWFVNIKRSEKLYEGLQGEPKHWLWGNLNTFPGLNEAMITREITQLMPIYPTHKKFWIGPARMELMLYHPEVLQELLRGSEPKPSLVGNYRIGKPWIGDGLLLSSGQKWSRNRRLLTPAFHFDILKHYVKIKNSAIEPLLKRFNTAARANESMEMFEAVSLYTFDVILRCAMSYEDDIQREGPLHPYLQAVKDLTEIWAELCVNPILQNEFLFKLSPTGRKFYKQCDYVHATSEQIIRNRMQLLSQQQTTDETKPKVLDFLTILIQARDSDGNGLTFSEIRDEVDTFLFEGHDTTTSGISWILYAMASHPEHQVLCQQEIDSVLADRDSDEILWEDLPQLKYLTLCIKEALRMYPPVPAIQRQITKPLTIKGVTFPVGQVFTLVINNLHHNPHIWENSMEFKPERFLPENFDKMDNFAYVPFSAGPRNCIGQHFAMHEMKVTVARILRRFTLTPDPACPPKRRPLLVMKTENGLRLLVKSRNK